MPVFLESYITNTFTWLSYAILAVAIVLCGGACVCVNCSLLNVVLNFILSSLNILQQTLNEVPKTIKERFSATDDNTINHHILDIKPDYDIDINKIISGIANVFNRVSVEYPVSEKLKKYRSPQPKFDVRGWRRRINERWRKRTKKIKSLMLGFKDKQVPSDDIPGESEETSGYLFLGGGKESSSSSNSRISYSEQLIMQPQRDTDPNLNKTRICHTPQRKLICLKAKADGTWITHYE